MGAKRIPTKRSDLIFPQVDALLVSQRRFFFPKHVVHDAQQIIKLFSGDADDDFMRLDFNQPPDPCDRGASLSFMEGQIEPKNPPYENRNGYKFIALLFGSPGGNGRVVNV